MSQWELFERCWQTRNFIRHSLNSYDETMTKAIAFVAIHLYTGIVFRTLLIENQSTMKTIVNSMRYKLPLLLLALLSAAYSFAEETATSIAHAKTTRTATTATDTEAWYNAPWAWIIGAGLLLGIMLIFINGSNNNHPIKRNNTRTPRLHGDY
jgi:hypothetical protein